MALTFANKITVGRILIVPFFIATVLYYTPERDYFRLIALGVFLTAVVTDVIDGYIARRLHQRTKVGAILDPVADKLLLSSAFIYLYNVGLRFPKFDFPIWLVVGLISRDAILFLGASVLQMTTGRMEVEANFFGKMTAFLQILCVMGMLLQLEVSKILWPVTFTITIVSGLIYIREGMKRF